ncbi:hypothetical protein COCCADRAFT_97697 [Bipolaris zeicola 26-R-13]|uniref:Impact N-terminal domain-containing protein n=1 Tax=Cochliobolus carbonum (strain 26-R-13) TaxID=930089 RepID=W6YBI8_COCC2|nr:uncharacterized protein COCCADRAFT_97697 [Bipolaris zeicola 26-R-13]EUC32859.1 hypothetical protein COCCADRAFT_97697 [Bipolaris zeicola 26-R-13]
MAGKRQHSPSPAPAEIYFSAPIHEQTSSFTAAFSPSLSAKALQALPEFRTATHRIAAWRKPSRQKSLMPASHTLYETGYDDDGEKWAGTRLSNVLRDTSTCGTVVVGRWYGGQNIGPIRFTHIESSAKEAIRKAKVAGALSSDSAQQASSSASHKKQKVQEEKEREEARRKELIGNLQERDYNIFALRKLLSEKKARLQGEGRAELLTPQKLVDYDSMSMEALGRVDKARDATIAFILKQIDKIDEEAKLAETLDASGGEEVLKDADKNKQGRSTSDA